MLIALVVSACSTVQTAKEAEGLGETAIYKSTTEECWIAMLEAVENTGGKIKESHQNDCYILAAYPLTAFSWGEKVAVFCKANDNQTEIEVVSKAALKIEFFVVDRASQLFEELDRSLPRVQESLE